MKWHKACSDSAMNFSATSVQDVSPEVALRLVEISPGICFVFGRDGRIEYANSEMERELGYSSEDAPGLSMWSLIHPRDRGSMEEALCTLTGELELDARVRGSDGEYKRMRWRLVSSGDRVFGWAQDKRDPGGDLAGYTEEEHEEQMLKSIGVLAGGIAHDFNNLLTGIIGSASLAAQDLPWGDPARRLMENVITAGQRAADLTQQLLTYAGKGRIAISRLDLSDAVTEMIGLLRASIPESVQLELDLALHLPAIEADGRQLRQIAYNLLINAVEAVDGQGVVRISTGRVNIGQESYCSVVASKLSPGEYVYCQVEDTGTGIDKEVKARIFDPFFTTKSLGRGLGLAAVSGFN